MSMTIDIHGHVSAPPELYSYKSRLLASRGYNRYPGNVVPEDRLREETDKHVQLLDGVGTDVQFISPRPFQLMHSESPASIVRGFAEVNNDTIARVCEMEPERFKGIAGLPQSPETDMTPSVKELERCVRELGFIGCLLNPDPTEGAGSPPRLDDRYWYPLYEKMSELGVPALIHSAGSKDPRETYSARFITEETITILNLIGSDVFKDFPDLKIVVAHGGGSVPYQIGRWRAARIRQGGETYDFDEDLRRFYFDSVLYNKESIDFLLRMVGTDRVMFGTEKPGSGSSLDAETGRYLDDLKPVIEDIDWLSDDERAKVLEGNARDCYSLLK